MRRAQSSARREVKKLLPRQRPQLTLALMLVCGARSATTGQPSISRPHLWRLAIVESRTVRRQDATAPQV